jgi:hypothetical protein
MRCTMPSLSNFAQKMLWDCLGAEYAAGGQISKYEPDYLKQCLLSLFDVLRKFREDTMYRRTSISGTTFSGKKCLSETKFHAI